MPDEKPLHNRDAAIASLTNMEFTPESGEQVEPLGHHLQPTLGRRLKALRVEKGLSLAEVSAGTDISRSFLSMVEKGESEITIGRLVRLVQFYDVRVIDFVEQLDLPAPGVVRAKDRRHISSAKEKMDFWLLTDDADRSMLPIYFEIQPGGGLAESGRHPGEEFLHLLEGELVIKLGGGEPIQMVAGDTAWISGEQTHALENPGEVLARALSVVTPPNL